MLRIWDPGEFHKWKEKRRDDVKGVMSDFSGLGWAGWEGRAEGQEDRKVGKGRVSRESREA